ncbi:hypothetical protein HMPREF9946_00033 [Acetobacteraceae bacterium AT-5844]|nr:hypothetical protein HMPREF9946_00033 [Acetobacteraceae bacterium AT-5844]
MAFSCPHEGAAARLAHDRPRPSPGRDACHRAPRLPAQCRGGPDGGPGAGGADLGRDPSAIVSFTLEGRDPRAFVAAADAAGGDDRRRGCPQHANRRGEARPQQRAPRLAALLKYRGRDRPPAGELRQIAGWGEPPPPRRAAFHCRRGFVTPCNAQA